MEERRIWVGKHLDAGATEQQPGAVMMHMYIQASTRSECTHLLPPSLARRGSLLVHLRKYVSDALNLVLMQVQSKVLLLIELKALG